jgi:hypothetical protein
VGFALDQAPPFQHAHGPADLGPVDESGVRNFAGAAPPHQLDVRNHAPFGQRHRRPFAHVLRGDPVDHLGQQQDAIGKMALPEQLPSPFGSAKRRIVIRRVALSMTRPPD